MDGTETDLPLETALCRQARLDDVVRHATHAVAALLRFAAVGVEDAAAEVLVRFVRRQHGEELVEADAGAPVAPGANPRRVEFRRLGEEIHDHEVVAQAVHFGEAQPHRWLFHLSRTMHSRRSMSLGVSRLRATAKPVSSTSTSGGLGRLL